MPLFPAGAAAPDPAAGPPSAAEAPGVPEPGDAASLWGMVRRVIAITAPDLSPEAETGATSAPVPVERLRAWQASVGLPPSGMLDSATLALLGGPPAGQARWPRVLYSVPPGDTLGEVANRFAIPVARLVAFNLDKLEKLAPTDALPAGMTLTVPISLPLHPGMRLAKGEPQPGRWVATYRLDLSFARVAEVADWFRARLIEAGYSLKPGEGQVPPDGLRFAGGPVALGTVLFSPGDEENSIFVDLALVLRPSYRRAAAG